MEVLDSTYHEDDNDDSDEGDDVTRSPSRLRNTCGAISLSMDEERPTTDGYSSSIAITSALT